MCIIEYGVKTYGQTKVSSEMAGFVNTISFHNNEEYVGIMCGLSRKERQSLLCLQQHPWYELSHGP